MSAVTVIIDIILILVSLILIVSVLMQQGQRQGLGAIGGGAETFFGKNKAKSYEGKLATLTKICAIVFIVLAMVATIIAGNKDTASSTAKAVPSVETAEPEETDEAASEGDTEAAPEEDPEAAPEEDAEAAPEEDTEAAPEE